MNKDINTFLSYSYEFEYDFSDQTLSQLNDLYKGAFSKQMSYYKFISVLSKFNQDASYLEIGTEMGASLVAYMYSNKSGKVTSLDLNSIEDNVKRLKKRGIDAIDLVPECVKKKVDFLVGDGTNFKFDYKYDIIFIDAAHNGCLEIEIMNNLKNQNMLNNCIILFDDIYFSNAMFKFWNDLPYEKYDLSSKLNRKTGFGVILI